MRPLHFTFSSQDIAEQGVICGVDCAQFWLLDFFLARYFLTNSYPITIFDFGLNAWQKSWVEKRYPLAFVFCVSGFIKNETEMDPSLGRSWQESYGSEIWAYRDCWFKKPFACLKSPYAHTLWLDVDCEVLAPLNDLFACLQGDVDLALALDPKQTDVGYDVFNSGVIAFKKTSKVISAWAEACLTMNDRFRGDQDVLSFCIYQGGKPVFILPEVFNCSYLSPLAFSCKILHWMGSEAKKKLREKMALSQCVKIS